MASFYLNSFEAMASFEVKVSSIKVRLVNRSYASIQAAIKAFNPSGISVALRSIMFMLHLNGEYLGVFSDGFTSKPLILERKSSATFNLDLNLRNEYSLQVLWKAVEEDWWNWELTGYVMLETPLGSSRVPLKYPE